MRASWLRDSLLAVPPRVLSSSSGAARYHGRPVDDIPQDEETVLFGIVEELLI